MSGPSRPRAAGPRPRRLVPRHSRTAAWSAGNEVRPLIHGAAYFAELVARVPALRAGDLLLFTDWRGDPDERLTEAGPRISEVNRRRSPARRAGTRATR